MVSVVVQVSLSNFSLYLAVVLSMCMVQTNLPKLMTWNARSIRSKRFELFDVLLSSDISVCCLTETFLNSTDSFGHSDFITYRLDRDSPNRGGGI